MRLYFYSLSFTAIFSLTLACFVLYKKPKALESKLWFLMSLAVSGWSFSIAQSFVAEEYQRGLLFSRLCNISASFIPVFFTHFCLVLTGQNHKKNNLLRLGYANLPFFVLFGFTDFFENVRPISIFKFYANPGPLFYYYTVHFFFFSAYSEYILLKSLKSVPPEKRNQIYYIITATALGFITGGMAFLAVYGLPIEPVSAHFVWLYLALICYAIVKHRLMDITVVIKKSIVYGFLIGVITSLYFSVVYLSSSLFQNILGYRSWGFVLIVSTAIALIFKPLERKIQQLVDKYIFKKSKETLEAENLMLREEIQKQNHMKSVATLAAGMAHEIKNPLTSIKTFAEYLPDRYEDPDFRDKFKRIVVDEVDRVNNIVKQLLEFAKPQEPELKKVSINNVLDETIELLNSNLLSHGIRVVKNYTQDQKISADKAQLKQAFLNLFLNSIQAMPHGGTLSVSTSLTTDYPASPAGGRLLTTISDTGEGISEADLKRVFDPFFTTREDGTGLGLSIVHGIITKHGGKLEIKSKPGQGTTVSVILKC